MNNIVHSASAAPAAEPVAASVTAPVPAGSRSKSLSKSDEAVAKARRQTDGAGLPVLPDCCNVGTILRVVIVTNIGMALMALLSAQNLTAAMHSFFGSAAIAEPAMLATLGVMCPLRKLVNGSPRQIQWLIGTGIAALVAATIALIASPVLLPEARGLELLAWIAIRAAVAAAVAGGLIEWLRLRSLALQPSQAEGRLQALQARIRPHFLFNSLNTVLGLMRSNPRQAERTLENLSDLFRVFMKDGRELVALDEEVLLCKEYLSIEQLRLPDRLTVVWHVADMPGDALLPSLLLQPLIENAVHHGIEPSAEQGEISINISKHGERVRVEIVNPLADSPPTRPGNQMALSNIRERLSLTFDVEGQLVTSAEGGLFRATMNFPYRKERRRRDVRPNINTDR